MLFLRLCCALVVGVVCVCCAVLLVGGRCLLCAWLVGCVLLGVVADEVVIVCWLLLVLGRLVCVIVVGWCPVMRAVAMCMFTLWCRVCVCIYCWW